KVYFHQYFKGNTNLYFGVITGYYSFGFNSLNSGVNNIIKCTILKDLYFSHCYGFTKEELKNVLSNLNISNSKEKKVTAQKMELKIDLKKKLIIIKKNIYIYIYIYLYLYIIIFINKYC
ncbi:hypothetical protein H8356DRAFT_940488, partial [Neocallimastix lanati (nom. inval.)]